MLWSDFDDYLRIEHLHGKVFKVKIASVKVEKFFSKRGAFTKPVLYFEKSRKGLPLNASNRRMLFHLFGDETDKCIGQVIELRPITDNGSAVIVIAAPES